MLICAISDTHGFQNQVEIPECDVLLIAGDICPLSNHEAAYQAAWLDTKFRDWLGRVPAKHIIGVAGNHDWIFETHKNLVPDLPWIYLQDSEVVIDGVKFYGSPWQPPFYDWAFNAPENQLALAWEMIPSDVDVLITHTPARGLRDQTLGYRGSPPENTGSTSLLWEFENRLKPELHVFGHIHPAYGCVQRRHTLHANVSIVNEQYKPIHRPLRYELVTKDTRI